MMILTACDTEITSEVPELYAGSTPAKPLTLVSIRNSLNLHSSVLMYTWSVAHGIALYLCFQ